MNCGIYIITNVLSNKVYIGSSNNLKRRKYQHFSALKNGKHSNPYLQSAYDLHKKQVFHWMILEYCESELLDIREDYWITQYDSRNREKGYNLRTSERMEMAEETKAKISASLMGHSVSEKVIEVMTKNNPSSRLEVRQKISDTHRRIGKRPPGTKGLKFSEETKAKMSEAQKKRWRKERGL